MRISCLPLKHKGCTITKQLLWNLTGIRYDRKLTRLPETCVYGSKFNL